MEILKGKVVLITGGSRGIGAGMVRKMAEQGANVAFTYRSSSAKSEDLIEELKPMGVEIKAYQSDASNYEEAESLVKKVIEDFGTVNVLVNNAGITRDNLMLRMSEEQWDEVMQNNLKSVFNLTKQVLRPMMRNREGSIINISSVVGVMGNAGQANYAASKAGMIGFTKSIAKELGSRNIRCNAIAPGFIETEMTDELGNKDQYLANIPLKRFGTVDEIADATVFLASDMSGYITGQVISICGGMNS
ncbi:3-oxoacyl-[acyl-carrier-protein] reductase [Membranihabitans maritimus]|uniref:3-oxoacyl-[acyl-carrier-protein] reductase n=1 Tax=Membranihabitans maritimus TaxID=2904244 RepID=UPI001F016649|nr:3-oxoacyl-[acyl-carrier-protein] reductase [Membranihabitans maritimus]